MTLRTMSQPCLLKINLEQMALLMEDSTLLQDLSKHAEDKELLFKS